MRLDRWIAGTAAAATLAIAGMLVAVPGTAAPTQPRLTVSGKIADRLGETAAAVPGVRAAAASPKQVRVVYPNYIQ